jgi:probable rRNA maturation factor
MVTFDFTNQTEEDFPIEWVDAAVSSAWKVEGLELDKHVEISILPDDQMKELNVRTRGKDYVPDVLSFPMSEPGDSLPMLGEMYLSASKIYTQAQEYGHSHCEEFLILCIHGMFHIMGYDHIADDEWEIMKVKEAHALELAKKMV